VISNRPVPTATDAPARSIASPQRPCNKENTAPRDPYRLSAAFPTSQHSQREQPLSGLPRRTKATKTTSPLRQSYENRFRECVAVSNPPPAGDPSSGVAEHNARPSFDDGKNVFYDPQDILIKAQDFGMKIWRLESARSASTRCGPCCSCVLMGLFFTELEKVLRSLLGIDAGSPTKPSALKQPKPLEHLLRAEARSGVTSERDPQTLRNDYIYFASKSRYVLVEDSSSEHRPILHQQYNSPDEYPTLFGGVEGKSAFVRGERPSRPPPPLPPAQRALAKAGGYNALCLRRSLSHTQLQKKRVADEKAEGEGFLAASGNSIAITSNIASGTTSARSAGAAGALNRPSSALAASLAKKTLVTLEGAATGGGGEVGKLKRCVSVETGLKRKADAQCGPKKPGYCENCRAKYEDFNSVRDHFCFFFFLANTVAD
jgi:regulatory subunit for Cdc7p protein kinase